MLIVFLCSSSFALDILFLSKVFLLELFGPCVEFPIFNFSFDLLFQVPNICVRLSHQVLWSLFRGGRWTMDYEEVNQVSYLHKHSTST